MIRKNSLLWWKKKERMCQRSLWSTSSVALMTGSSLMHRRLLVTNATKFKHFSSPCTSWVMQQTKFGQKDCCIITWWKAPRAWFNFGQFTVCDMICLRAHESLTSLCTVLTDLMVRIWEKFQPLDLSSYRLKDHSSQSTINVSSAIFTLLTISIGAFQS